MKEMAFDELKLFGDFKGRYGVYFGKKSLLSLRDTISGMVLSRYFDDDEQVRKRLLARRLDTHPPRKGVDYRLYRLLHSNTANAGRPLTFSKPGNLRRAMMSSA